MIMKTRSYRLNRRQFMSATVLCAGRISLWARDGGRGASPRQPQFMLGDIRKEAGTAPIEGAAWYAADSIESGFECRFAAGALAKANYITADMLLDGSTMVVFILSLQEREQGRRFSFRFAGLNQCSFRVRMPLGLVDQNRWGIEREGAFLKPRCSGDRVDLDKVDRMRLVIHRKGPAPARWCMTSFRAAEAAVSRLDRPLLPRGPLIDELG